MTHHGKVITRIVPISPRSSSTPQTVFGPARSMLRPGASEFSAWFHQFQRSCFRLETLQRYGGSGEDDSIRTFLAGANPQPHPGKQDWMALVRAATRDRRTMQRVHAVTEPLTDYVRFEVAWSYAHSVTRWWDRHPEHHRSPRHAA
ncbi:MAG: DUF6879 family protein [Pseudonocardiaceae bacterium]